ncbi:MAG: hypothetical protein AAAB23_27600, partial [Pseudomonas sp.]
MKVAFRSSFCLEVPALDHAALKVRSECSLTKVNSASSQTFALPDLRSATSSQNLILEVQHDWSDSGKRRETLRLGLRGKGCEP